jgi:hypothetical protein
MRAKAAGSAATDTSAAISRARETRIAGAGDAKKRARKARCSIAICAEGNAY